MIINSPVIINGVQYESWEVRSVCWELESSVLTFNLYYHDNDSKESILHRQVQYIQSGEVDVNKMIELIKAEHKNKIFL